MSVRIGYAIQVERQITWDGPMTMDYTTIVITPAMVRYAHKSGEGYVEFTSDEIDYLLRVLTDAEWNLDPERDDPPIPLNTEVRIKLRAARRKRRSTRTTLRRFPLAITSTSMARRSQA
jgi:hypothetical protein